MDAISDPTGFADGTLTLEERLLDVGIEDGLVMTGYDDCAIGVLERFGMEPIVIYDKAKVIKQLMEELGDDEHGANEFYEFNQLGAWHGDKTPGFLIIFPEI